MTTQLRVLNLDDNDAARYARSRGLASVGFDVVDAATGAQALEIADSGAFDVALLDVVLPDMSGLEVTRRMRANPRTSALRIAQISAVHVEPEDEAESLRNGADIYLRSPLAPGVLAIVVETLARLRRSAAGERSAQGLIIPGTTIGIAHLDLAGYFNQANRCFSDMTARSPQQLCRMTVRDLFHPDDAAAVEEQFRQMTRGDGNDFRMEARLAGEEREVRANCSFSLVRSASGVVREAVLAIVGVSTLQGATHAKQPHQT